MSRKLAALLLAAVCILNISVFAAPLSDLSEDDWYYTEVTEMVAQGYITGYPDGTFRGEADISLIEFLTVTARLANVECGEQDGYWAGRQLAEAKRLGWVDEQDLSAVELTAPIPREMAAKVLAKALELPRAVQLVRNLHIWDHSQIDARYAPYVAAAWEAGLFSGDEQGRFLPQGSVSRGAAAVLFYRSLRLEDPLARYTKQEIIDYFVEVTIYSGNTAVGEENVRRPIRKWLSPIYFSVSGSYAPEHMETLRAVMDKMNATPGFPGIYEASASGHEANMELHFLGNEAMDRVTGEYLPNQLDGYYYIWWNGDYQLIRSEISYRASLTPAELNSTLCEELLQATGLGNDSYTYSDSIFYEPYMPTQWPTALDWKLFELLYNPAIRPGMNEAQVRQILDTLILSD